MVLPANPGAGPAAVDPGTTAPFREELYLPPVLLDLAIWVEDLTAHPERAGGISAIPIMGMDEGCLDPVLSDAVVIERRYAAAGVLSGVRVKLLAENYCQFTTELRKASHLRGTISWVRNLAEPNYVVFWFGGRPLFRQQERVIGSLQDHPPT